MKLRYVVAAMLLPSLAHSHAALEQTQAESGSQYKGVMSISHGCDGSATTKITIDMPDGFRGAKPMPKPGWQVDIVTTPRETPYEWQGKMYYDDVSKITWFGNTLADDHFDEFVFKGLVAVGNTYKLYFPVHQECVVGAKHWVQTPEQQADAHSEHQGHDAHAGHNMGHAGHGGSGLSYPAPVVTVIDGQGHHHH